MAGAVFAQNKAFDDLNQSQRFKGLTPAMYSDVQQFMASPGSMQDHFNTMEGGYIAGNHFIPLASQAAASVANNAMGSSIAGGVVGAGTPQLDTSSLNGAITNLTAAINKLSQSVGGGVTGAPGAVAGTVAGGQPALASLPAGFFEGQTKVAGGPPGLAPIPTGFFEGLPAISSPDTRVHTSAGTAIASFNSGSLRPITTAPDARVFVNAGRAVPSFDSNIGFGTISPDARTGGAGAVASFNSGVAQHTNLNFPQPPSSLPVISPLSGVGTAVSSFNSGFVPGVGASIHSFPQANNVVFHAPSLSSSTPFPTPTFSAPASHIPVNVSALGNLGVGPSIATHDISALGALPSTTHSPDPSAFGMLGSTPATQGRSGAGQQLLSGLQQHYGSGFNTPAPAFTPIPKATPSTSGHSIMGAFRSGLAGGMIHQDHTFMQRKAVHAGRYAVAATREFLNAETSTNLHSTISVMPGEGRMLGQGLRILDEQTSIQVPVNRALARASSGDNYGQIVHEGILNEMVESGFMDLPDAAEFIATTTSLSGDTNAALDLFFAHKINEDAEGQAGLMGMLNARGMGGKALTDQAVHRARNNGIRGAAVTIAADAEIQAILEERTSGVGTRGRGGRRGIIDEAVARGGRDMQLNIASIKRGRSQILRARNLITDPFKGVGEALLFAHALEAKDGDLVEAHHFLSDMSVGEKTSLFRSVGGRGLSDMLRLQGGEESGDLGPAGDRMTEQLVQAGVATAGLEVAKAVGKAQLRLRKETLTPDREAVNLVRINKESDLQIHQLGRMDEKVKGGRGVGAARRESITREFGAQVEDIITEVRNLEKTMDTASKAIVEAAKKFKFKMDPNDNDITAAFKQISNVGMTVVLQTIMNTAGMRSK
jgi:hypothetical protein